MATIHIIGASISGLAAAVELVDAHLPVKLYEASAHAGGRYRSSAHDHIIPLIRKHDRATLRFLERIGTPSPLIPLQTLGLPRASLMDYAILARYYLGYPLSRENPLLDAWASPTARTFCHTEAEHTAPSALRRFALPRPAFGFARSLKEALIAPALHRIEYGGGSVYYGHELTQFGADTQHLQFARKKLPLASNDIVLIATGADATARWLPDIEVPSSHRAITFAFRVVHREPTPSIHMSTDTLYDLIRFDEEKITVMIRPAGHVWKRESQALVNAVRKDLCRQYPYLKPRMLKAHTIWREANAGHVMDEASITRALPNKQPHPRCILAGDWLDPTQPATLESAIASGVEAARLARDIIDKARQQ